MTEKAHIRPIAICIFRHIEDPGRILSGVFYDGVKDEWFCRPLGGGIEFGERSHEALIREIREELNTEIEDLRCIGVLENAFTYRGKPGHEIVFVYDAKFRDKSFYQKKNIAFHEIETEELYAQWHTLKSFEEGKLKLYPEGLLEALLGQAEK